MSEGHVASEKQFLDAIDYSVLVGLLVTSVSIGLYFAFVNKRKPNTPSEYLTGNKELSVFPIVMSLVSSQVSGISYLGNPAEVYMYGSQIMIMVVSGSLGILALLYIFMPIYCSINILSSFEYFTKRFNHKVAILGSVLYVIRTLLFSAVVVYVPAIALAQLSGVKIEILIPVLSIICIFCNYYTLQTIFMSIGAIGLAIVGTHHVGGFKNVWERNYNSGRIEFFNLDPDPRVRSSFWSVSIGLFFHVLAECATNQMTVQRCMALSTFKKIKITMWSYAIVMSILMTCIAFNGLVAFAIFYDCDPVTTKTVRKADQIMPYLWMFLTKDIPALPGLFMSALFSASFSTISTTLNCMAGVFVISIVKPLSKRPLTEEKVTSLMKIMVVIFGCLVLSLAFLIDKMGALFQVVISFSSLIIGPLLGMFLLGMFCPRVGAKAVLIACLVAFSCVAWIFIGSQIAINQNQIFHPKKNFSIEGCDNSTLQLYYSSLAQKRNFTINRTKPFPLYAISYHYYALIAIFIMLVVGWIVSYFDGNNDRRIKENENLYSPMIRKLIGAKREEMERMALNNIGNTD